MLKVAAYILRGNGLAGRVVPLMIKGAEANGDVVDTYVDTQFDPEHVERYDVAILWGYVLTCQSILHCFREAGKQAVYLDLAYWDRSNCYKVSVNDRHPTAYFQQIKHDDRRRNRFGIEPQPYAKKGHQILVAGMSAKAAWAEKQEPVESWERNAIAELRKHTDRPIVYRPKPSWGGAKPLEGASYSNPRAEHLDVTLSHCHAVVTHHSNTAVDGLVAGVPAFVQKGVAQPMSLSDLSQIETPLYPEEREQWVNDIAYTQWSTKEMKNGTCWAHLKEEELV